MKLQEYLDSIKLTEIPNPLPFIHSCEGFLGEEIVKEDELKTTVCPVFKKELLYFFYGKPAYYVADKETNSRTDELYCPCCFILDETRIKINTVYPFDSGGFMGKRYHDFFHDRMNIDNYALNTDLESIQKFVDVFFNDNDNYIKGISKTPSCINDTYIDSLINLFNATGSFAIDERARTIEIISDESVKLKDTVIGIVVPYNLYRKDSVREFIETNHIDFRTYFFRPLTKPSGYNQVVFERAIDLLRQKGKL